MMRLIATAQLLGVSMLMASSATSFVPENASSVLQGGALAVLSWVVWYMLAKALPAHNKALKDQREDFLAALKEDRQQFYKSMQEPETSRKPKSPSPYDASVRRTP